MAAPPSICVLPRAAGLGAPRLIDCILPLRWLPPDSRTGTPNRVVLPEGSLPTIQSGHPQPTLVLSLSERLDLQTFPSLGSAEEFRASRSLSLLRSSHWLFQPCWLLALDLTGPSFNHLLRLALLACHCFPSPPKLLLFGVSEDGAWFVGLHSTSLWMLVVGRPSVRSLPIFLGCWHKTGRSVSGP